LIINFNLQIKFLVLHKIFVILQAYFSNDMFKSIIKKVFYKRLKKEFLIAEKKRVNKLVSFNDLKSFLIIFDAEQEEVCQAVFSIIKELKDKGNNVHSVGYLPYKVIPHYCFPKLTYDYVYSKNTNLLKIPTGLFVKDVIDLHFDVLIDFTKESIEPVFYITALSKASLKISRTKNENEFTDKVYDITIAGDELSNKEFFFEVKKYLNALTPNK